MKLFLPLLFFAGIHLSQAQTFFKASTFSCSDHCLVAAPGGNYFNAMHRIIGGLSRASLLKTDSAGNCLWHREFLGPDIVAPSEAVLTYDSCYVIANWLRYSGGNDQLYIIKMDDNGDTVWTRLYTEIACDIKSTSVLELPNHQLVFFGKKTSPNRIFIMKTDEFGQLLFEKNFTDPAPGYTECRGMATSDGGFALTGGRWALIKTDAQFNLQWFSTYAFNYFYDSNRYLLESPDHELVLFGQDSVIGGIFDYLFLKYSLSGNLTDQKVYPGLHGFDPNNAALLKDKGYLLTGSKDTSGGHFVPSLVKLDSSLNISWAQNYLPDFSVNQYGQFQTSIGLADGRIVSAGIDLYPPHSLPQNLLMKAEADGNSCNNFPYNAGAGLPFAVHHHSEVPADTTGSLQLILPTFIYIGVHIPTFNDRCSTTYIDHFAEGIDGGKLVNHSECAWQVALQDERQNCVVTVYDLSGRILLEQHVTDGERISHGSFAKGCYVYRFLDGHRFSSGLITK